MSCVCPIDCWRSTEVSESGKCPIVFTVCGADLTRPLQVPCGRCVGCCADRALIWSIRVFHESTLHKQNSFLTLTYSDAPESVSKRDLQLFFKRLRKFAKVRYFACGEYGSHTHRPHYHVCLFGVDFLADSYAISDSLYGNRVLDDCWSHGLCSVGSLTLASAMYVAGYVSKKIGDPDTFNLMSTRPAIGRGWLDKFVDDIRRTGKVVIDGQEFTVPKKYLEWYSDELVNVIDARREFARTGDWWLSREQLPAKQLLYESRNQLKVSQI
ncbi:MAG: replication initiator protein [Microviridae sp.]|nr:MAG: replication initiator protein [Microviridae sp.]